MTDHTRLQGYAAERRESGDRRRSLQQVKLPQAQLAQGRQVLEPRRERRILQIHPTCSATYLVLRCAATSSMLSTLQARCKHATAA